MVNMGNNQSMDKIITIGSATRDSFFITDKDDVFRDPQDTSRTLIAFEFGTKVEIEDLRTMNGGGATNSAVSFSRLGFKSKTIARVGDDELGHAVKKDLEKDGVDTSKITFDKKKRTGVSAIIIDKKTGERTVLFYPGANMDLKLDGLNDFEEAKLLYLAPITSNIASESLPQVCVQAKEKGLSIAYNPSAKQLNSGYKSIEKIISCTDVLLMNRQEAGILVSSYTGKKTAEYEADELLTYLQEMGPQTSVITLGSGGSIAMSNGAIFKKAPFPAKAVDTTGAGDAFGSTFVASLITGNTVQRSLKLASINASSVISKYGAHTGLMTLKQLEKRMQKAA